MRETHQTGLFDDTAHGIIEQLKPIARGGDQIEVGQLLVQLKSLVDGRFAAHLRLIRPELSRPEAWAYRAMKRVRASTPHHREHAPDSQPAQGPSVPSRARGRSQESSPRSLDERTAALYSRLRPLLDLPPSERAREIDRLAGELHMSARTLRRKLRAVRGRGAAGLQRPRRRDAGEVRLPEEMKRFFLRRRLDPATRHERLSVSIDLTAQAFPGESISRYSLGCLALSLPRAATMADEEWRKRFLPIGHWEVPHPNHTWAFDFTRADLFVWDGDPERDAYRPWLTAIVDECTQSCMFGAYTEQAPNREILAGVLLHAILPKSDPLWIQCGAPLHLHADNGKVQDSEWLRAVCETMGTDLRLMEDVRQTAVRSPWQDGHVENFFGIVHARFESQFPPAYCGRSPQHKPESHRNRGAQDWREYPTLASLNVGFQAWVGADYHRMRHRRLKMSRVGYWQIHAQGHVQLPDESYLYQALMRRERRKIARARVSVNGMTYWSERLMSWDGMPLEVRWDPADLGRVMVIGSGGETIWAEREPTYRVDNPADLAEHKGKRKRVREERRIIQQAAELTAGDPRSQQTYADALREAKARAPIPFPALPEHREPKARPTLSMEEAARIAPGSNADDDEPLTIFGIEI